MPLTTATLPTGTTWRLAQQMKVFISAISQETNSFCPRASTLQDFARGYHLLGGQIPEALAATNTEVGGFYSLFRKDRSAQVTPGIAAWAIASGPLEGAAFEALYAELAAALQAALPVDGILLSLHGALACAEIEDAEGELLRRLRRLVGDTTLIACSLDYHACVTAQMLRCADFLVGHRTYPHVDFQETGRAAAAGLRKLLQDQPALTKILCRLPLILPVERTETSAEPIAGILGELQRLIARGQAFSASFFCPQPWLDVAETGVSIVIYAHSQYAAGCRQIAREMMRSLWDQRGHFFQPFADIATFLDHMDRYQRPLLVVDSGDIITAGGVGDSTELLRALLARSHGDLRRSVLTIVDPETVARAVALGEGRSGMFRPGGSEDGGYNARVPIAAKVVRISEEPVEVVGAAFSGLRLSSGRRVRLDTQTGITLLATEHSSLLYDPAFLRQVGIAPEQCDLIQQKSHKLFRPAYAGMGGSCVILDTPGVTDMNLRRLPFRRLRRPVYPLDDFVLNDVEMRSEERVLR